MTRRADSGALLAAAADDLIDSADADAGAGVAAAAAAAAPTQTRPATPREREREKERERERGRHALGPSGDCSLSNFKNSRPD